MLFQLLKLHQLLINQPILHHLTVSNLGLVIGFDLEVYAFTNNALASVNVVNLQLTNTIELMSDIVEKSTLSVIIPDNTDFSVITYNEQNAAFASHPLTITNVRNARFYLLDGNTSQPLDLNGLNFNFTFAIYKKINYFKADRKLELPDQMLNL